MGCNGSKANNTPAVVLNRKRQAFIRAAAKNRNALAAAHVSYFRSLKDVGDAIQKFFEDGQITADSDSSGPSSPHLTLSPRNSKQDNGSPHLLDDDYDGSHLNLSDSSDSEGFAQHLHESDDNDMHQHHHNFHTNPHHTNPPHGRGSEDDMHQHHHNNHTRHHHGRGSEDDMNQHHHNQPRNNHYGNVHRKKEDFFDDDVSHLHSEEESSSNFHPRGGFNGYNEPHHYPNPHGDGVDNEPHQNQDPHCPFGEPHMDHRGPQVAESQPRYNTNNTTVHYMMKGAPAAHTVFEEPPPEPSYAYSDSYFNPAAGFGHSGNYGFVSCEVVRVNQKKEAPPPPSPPKASEWDFFNLFVEVDNDEYYSSGRHEYRSNFSSPDSTGVKEREGIPDFEEETESDVYKKEESLKGNKGKKEAKMDHSNYNNESSSSRKLPLPKNNGKLKQVPKQKSESSSKSVSSWSSEENAKPYKGEASRQDSDSSKLSSATISSPRGTRDLGEAVAEFRDEFKRAASYGEEVAVMLAFGKVPYQPSFLKAIVSKTMKLANSYFDDVGKDENAKACNLSSTLDELYTWEKRLYKEVKDYENLQLLYEKQRRRLYYLEKLGAEPSKTETARISIDRLRAKLNFCKKGIDKTSTSLNKLRDEKLQPRVAELIHGLIRMWKSMLICHQKQFQALKESKMQRLKVNTSFQTDPTSRATTELERELCAWCHRFNDWIASQKSYVESLNGWLLHWLLFEPEVTPDGPVPYSPGRLEAPPIFVICNDWHQSLNAISEVGVSNAMNTFAEKLRQLWKKQEEEGRQRLVCLKAEDLLKEYEKQQKQQQPEGKGKTGLSVVASDHSGVLRRDDDLPLHLDYLSQKLTEERVKHAEAMRLLDKAASTSLQEGLIPIFKALEVFSADALKAHEQVRLQQPGLVFL